MGSVVAAALGLTACGGANADEDNANLVAPATSGAEGMGENAAMMNDMTTPADVAIGNDQSGAAEAQVNTLGGDSK